MKLSSPWLCTALVPSFLESRVEGYLPDWDLDPHVGHLYKKMHPVSADGALEAENACTHGMSLQQEHR